LNYGDIVKTIFLGFVGLAFFLMFVWAVWKGEFIFHGGYIRGKVARAIGIIGLVGMAAGLYLIVSFWAFKTTSRLALFAGLLCGLSLVILLAVRFLSIFIRHSK